MRRCDAFFNNLAQVLFESNSSAANNVKRLARWPDLYRTCDKAMLVALLKAAAEDELEIGAP